MALVSAIGRWVMTDLPPPRSNLAEIGTYLWGLWIVSGGLIVWQSNKWTQTKSRYTISCATWSGETWNAPESLGEAYGAVYPDRRSAHRAVELIVSETLELAKEDCRFKGLRYEIEEEEEVSP